MLDTLLSVSEMFGPTIQGEGPSQGKPVVFLRLGLCNLDCSWCDTPYTWDWTGKNGTVYNKADEVTKMPIHQVLIDLLMKAEPNVDRLVISGGEPMLQQKRLAYLIDEWPGPVEIETNGTIEPSETIKDLGAQFNCSPKLSNSGIDYETRIIPETLKAIKDCNSSFKFVVDNPLDLIEVNKIVNEVIEIDDPSRIYLMPEGTYADQIQSKLPWVMEQAATYGYSVSPRLHVIAYNNLRGV